MSRKTQNQPLKYLIDPSFQVVNSLFYHLRVVTHRARLTGYFLPTVESSDYIVMIDSRSTVKNNIRTY